jgi:pilus assembly protein Flp/PilA
MKRVHIIAAVTRFFREEAGATAIEYGLLVALLAMSLVFAVGGAGNQVASTLSGIASKWGIANTAS